MQSQNKVMWVENNILDHPSIALFRENDANLTIPPPPPYKSLLHSLVQRHLTIQAPQWKKWLILHLYDLLLTVLGFKKTHKQLLQFCINEPNYWWSPSGVRETSGFRFTDCYFSAEACLAIPINSYSCLLKSDYAEASDLEMLSRASMLVHALLTFRHKILLGEIPIEPHMMQGYNCIFSSSLISHDVLVERFVASPKDSSHIIVMINGHMYEVPLYSEQAPGSIPPPLVIHQQLRSVLDLHSHLTTGTSEQHGLVPILTSMPLKSRGSPEQELRRYSGQNMHNFLRIREAIFVLCLDKDNSPSDPNLALQGIQGFNPINRWYDKGLNVVVFGNGKMGYLCNYLMGITGTIGARIGKEAASHIKELEGQPNLFGSSKTNFALPIVKPLLFDVSSSLSSSLSTIAQDYCYNRGKRGEKYNPFKPLPAVDVIKFETDLCAEFFEKYKISRGALLNMAFYLTLQPFYDNKKVISIKELISVRHFKDGAAMSFDTPFADIQSFVQKSLPYLNQSGKALAPRHSDSIDLFHLFNVASQSYREEVKQHKLGYFSSWHFHALLRILGLPNRIPTLDAPCNSFLGHLKKTIRSFCIGFVIKKGFLFGPPDAVISNPGACPDLEAFGRAGVHSTVPVNTMAIHYLIQSTGITLILNPNPLHPCYGKQEQFIERFQRVIQFLADLIKANKA